VFAIASLWLVPMSAYKWFTDYLEVAGAVHIGRNWQCPAHEDSYPSMTLMESKEGTVLLFCHAGCNYTQIVESLGLSARLLFEPHVLPAKRTYEMNLVKPKFNPVVYRPSGSNRSRREDFFIANHYYSESVRLERIKFESGEKICRWQVFEEGRWVYSNGRTLDLNELPLYNETEVIRGGYVGEVIVVCESESSVDALSSSGIYATTWAGGASSLKVDRLRKVLKDQRVLWVPDNDVAGLKCSTRMLEEVAPVSAEWKSILGDPNEDAKDMLSRGALSLGLIDEIFL
jgi:hypothetical protein